MSNYIKRLKKPLLFAGILIASAFTHTTLADTVLIGVFGGNDGINPDGSTQLEALTGLAVDVDQLDRVNWNFDDADGDSSNGIQVINPQSSGDFIITGTEFKIPDDPTEATDGTWEYIGLGTIDYLTVKFDSFVALYQITGGMTSGTWSTSDICTNDSQYCQNNGDPYALSHAAAYTVVPVPATAWLFGSALLGLVGAKRRK
jgi:hypothetical protein